MQEAGDAAEHYSRCMATALILSTRREEEREKEKKPAKTYNSTTKFIHKSRTLCKSRKNFLYQGQQRIKRAGFQAE